jgi:tetratricopeptide (TPR) repeat protein
MAEPIEQLVQRWKRSPNPATTIALCDALRETPEGPLVQQVGEVATQRHPTDVGVLVSVARMYLEAQRLGDAQTALVAAGKQAPRNGAIYRWLGEVLLRRGDAERAEKVLERAIQLGTRDPDAQLWMERARVFRPMQARAGTRAVATEVAHTTAHATRPSFDSLNDTATGVLVRPTEISHSDDAPTHAGPLPLSPAAVRPPPRIVPPTQPRWVRASVPTSAHFPGDPEPVPPTASRSPPAREAMEPESVEIAISIQQPLPTSPALPRRAGPPFEQARPTNGAPSVPAPFAADRAPPRAPEGPMVPHPRDVLDALALSGVFEPPVKHAGATAAWANAERGPKRKGAPTLIVGMVLFLAAGTGTYFAYRHKRAQEHLQADAVLSTVEAQLHAGESGSLPDVEKELSHAFQLESRSPRGALDWTRERALVGLVTVGADVAFEDAMARDKDLGVPEEKYAFARVASFLFQGDTAGAAAVMPRWDGPAGSDPWYQMVAGATLERAGDARARERYATAAKLDPDLVIAQVGLARATAIGGDAHEAMGLAQALRKSMPDRAEPVALVALSWGRDPNRESLPVPPEVDEVALRADDLPSGLKFVPHAIAALRAFDRHDADQARAEILQGLAVAESPGAAVWLGTIALPLGDEALARKGALAALQLSAVYEPARALAARVALLGGRLDEALKATEDLDAASPDVAVVRAAAAYERVDADGVTRALEALPPETRSLPFLAALGRAPDAVTGKLALDGAKIVTMAADDAPWSDLVAMDVALDRGDLASADKIAASWGKSAESNPLRALRLARLARYEGRLDAAEALSSTAIEHGTVTPRALWERVYLLVARNHASEVGPLLSHYPLVLGPLATWLSAYAAAAAGNTEAGKGRTASLDPPPAMAPIEARVIAAMAFAAMKDKRRGTDYTRDVLSTGSQDPDLVAAALALGFRKVQHFKRPPTYEYP